MSVVVQSPLLGRYEVVKQLGAGGYGAVFEARDRATGDRIALKRLINASASTLARFKQEFRAVQEVHHPNLVRLEALFEDEGKWTIAMELVEGTDLLAYVYDGDRTLCFNEQRLRDAFAQLADALSALHGAGFVHRDLKPSNVRITPEGRVVLLDFGLTMAVDPTQSMRATGIGTIAYMAPEQGASDKIGPEADWYAFGVCLYEALTGVLPIEGDTPFALLLAKQQPLAQEPVELVPGIPADLNALCVSLLSTSPAARPNGRAVRSALARPGDRPFLASDAPPKASTFEGRELELGMLASSYAEVERGAFRMVMVEGESGIGKSALVERFLALPDAPQRAALQLRSRCYENELLAFKAFDGAVDGLVRVLAKLDADACARLLPPRAALLCRLFPAFSAVKPLARVPLAGVAADPTVQRIEAFALFARLLTMVSAQRPLVIAIDDLQWADAESFRLLSALLSAPEAPRCLILATVRPRAELDPDIAEHLDALRKQRRVSELSIRGLPRANAMQLARELTGPDVPESWLDVIVEESTGHPLFLTMLTRHAESERPTTAAELTLDAAINARLDGLSRDERALLEVVATIGSPQTPALCGRAAGLSEGEVASLVAELCGQKLLRRRRAGEIACFHDQIRRIAVASLPPERSKDLHASIASALSTRSNSDPTELARHYEAADQVHEAFEAYDRAAQKAAATLAFDRVATLYARALDVSQTLDLPPERRTALMSARGDALARGGRSAEAARQYLDAAEQSSGAEQIRLRTLAVRHLLQSARIEQGMAAARTLLAELGVPLPESPAAIYGRLLWDRAYLGVRGLAVRASNAEVPVQARMQLDALWEMTMPVAWVDPVAAAVLSTRHLRLARAHCEPAHMARALCEEAFGRVIQRPDDFRVDELIARARSLAKGSTDPAIELCILFREAAISNMRWDLRRSHKLLEHAQQFGSENCPDQPWLLTNVRCVLGAAWANLGEHAKLAACTASWIDEARQRNDQFGQSVIEGLGFGTFRHLMAGDPDAGRSALDATLSSWPLEPFSFARFGEIIGVTNSELYRGGTGGYEWITREMPRLSRAFVLKTGLGKATLLMYRSHLALCARNAVTGERARQLVEEVRGCVQQLRSVHSALASLNVGSLEAQLAALAGDRDRALELARTVRAESEKHGGFWLGNTLDYFIGLLLGGDAGRDQQRSAISHFTQQGWKNPRRALALLCPVLDALE